MIILKSPEELRKMGESNTIVAEVLAGLREKVKVLIGGAPVTQEYADRIKADGYARDAGSAVHKAMELLGVQ